MSDSFDLEDWRTYPLSLPSQGCNAYGYDCDAYAEQLDANAERLFVSGQHICIKIVESRPTEFEEQILRAAQELDPYLKHSKSSRSIRLILIPQESSWGKLQITKECMLRLLSKLQAFPAFIDILRAFGQRIAVRDESYSGFYIQQNSNPSFTECAYTVKYPEEHGREGPNDPWSLRQTGVYDQHRTEGDSTFIVLHPSKAFLRRLKRSTASNEPLTPWKVQMMVVSAAMENWRWYVNELERRFNVKKTEAQLSSISTRRPGEYHANITFEDTQDIQVLQDKLSQSLHHLSTNHEVISQIYKKRVVMFGEQEQFDDQFIETLMIEASMEIKRVKGLLKRAEGTQALAQSILDFTCLESTRANTRTMTELTRLSQKEAEMLLDLSMKASRDTDILKTLALLTLIYLPASLVSSMMGMGYVKVIKSAGKISIDIEKEMWVFLVLVGILLVVTLGSYYLWLRKKRTMRQKYHMDLQWKRKHLTY